MFQLIKKQESFKIIFRQFFVFLANVFLSEGVPKIQNFPNFKFFLIRSSNFKFSWIQKSPSSARSDSAGVTCLSLLLALYSQYRGVLLHTYSLHSGGFFPSNKIMQVKCDYKLFPSSCHVKSRKQKGAQMKIFLAFLLSTSSPSPHKPSVQLRWSMIKKQV